MFARILILTLIASSQQNPLKFERVSFDMKYNQNYVNLTVSMTENNETIGLLTGTVLQKIPTCLVSELVKGFN